MKRKSSQIAKILVLLLSVILIAASMSVNVFAANNEKEYSYDCEDGHSYKTTRTKATTSANGKRVTKCTECGKIKSTKTIYKVSSVKLSASKFTYNGEKRTPTVTVKDSKGNKLVKGEDYKLTYSSSKRTAVGRYSVKVTFMGDYKGTKTLNFTIFPKNPSTVKARLYGYDDVKVSWSKVTGASGYRVYYKKNSADSWNYKTTTGTSMKIANLSDGVKYNVKVVAYKTVNDAKYLSSGKTVNITTLKKVNGIAVAKSGTKVKVSWNNISGETGYQISRSTSKTSTNIVSTFETTSGDYKTVSANLGTTYYYKVRAYKVVDGNKIYGPWSDVVKYTRKSHTHSYNSNYVCSCGAIDKAHAYEYLIEWVKDNGTVDGNYIELTYTSKNNINYTLWYSAQHDTLWVDTWNYTDNGYFTATSLCLEDGYYNCCMDELEMWGYIDPETFTDNTPITYEEYTGYTDLRSQMAEYTREGICLVIDWLDWCLDVQNVGITIDDLGFTAY